MGVAKLTPRAVGRFIALLGVWLINIPSTQLASADTLTSLTFITEEYPPYNYLINQQLAGFSIDLLEAIFAETETPLSRDDIHYYPWVRGYEIALSQPNTVLFSTTRNATREAQFHWVGPIAQDHVALLAHRAAPISLDSLAQAIERKLTVAVIREDIGAQALQEAGYPESLMIPAIDNRSALHMLTRGRVDLWAYSADVAAWIAESEGHPSNSLIPVHTLSDSYLYFAINQTTDPRLISRMQQALDNVLAELPQR